MNVASIDLADPMTHADGPPWEHFAQLRAEDPVSWNPPGAHPDGFWSLALYEDIVEVFKDWESFSSARKGSFLVEGGILPQEFAPLVFNMMDPPDHDRHRAILQKVFTAKAVSDREPDARRTVNQLIDEVIERGECDLVRDIAVELPLIVTANMLGVPYEDRAKLFEWTNTFADTAVPREDKMAAIEQIGGYLPEFVAARRENPTDDLLSRLIYAEVDGDRLNDIEVMVHFLQLMLGGSETTRNGFAGGILALIEYPDERRKLVDDPALMPNAVEEILRWHTPIIHNARTATRDLEIRGVPIAENDKVVMWMCSANRDPALNETPDVFDVSRERPKHMSFGAGKHFCLGNQLARLEIKIGVEEVLRRMDGLELAGPVKKRPNDSFHWMAEMPVRWNTLGG